MFKGFFILLSLLIINSSLAQFGSSGIGDAGSAGLAGTYNVLATGSYAFGINPANIEMTSHKGDLLFAIPFPQVNAKASTDFMTLKDLNYFFGGVDGEARNLTPEDVNRLNNLFKDGGDGSYTLAVNLISFTFSTPVLKGFIGFSISDVLAGNFHVPPDAVEFTLNGNMLNRIYSFSDANFKSWWLRNYSFTYARELEQIKPEFLDKLSAGLSVKLIHGYFYAGTEHVDSYIRTGENSEITARADYLAYTSFTRDLGIDYEFDDETEPETSMHPFPPPAGSGFGIDLGFSAIKNNWTFALALTDMGSIRWKNKTARFFAKGDIILDDIADHALRDSIENIISGEGEYVDGFTTGLPFALRTGAAYSFNDMNDDIPGNLILAADYNQGFNDRPGNTTSPRISIASEWQPLNWSFIRMGFSFGGLDGFNWAAGLGFAFGIIELNFATTNLAALPDPNGSRNLSLAFNSRWRF